MSHPRGSRNTPNHFMLQKPGKLRVKGALDPIGRRRLDLTDYSGLYLGFLSHSYKITDSDIFSLLFSELSWNAKGGFMPWKCTVWKKQGLCGY